MSQDLFAAFGSNEPSGVGNSRYTEPPSNVHAAEVEGGAQPGALGEQTKQDPSRDDEEDDFGDFEDASTEPPAPAITESTPREVPGAKSRVPPPQVTRAKAELPAPAFTEKTYRKPPATKSHVTVARQPVTKVGPAPVAPKAQTADGSHPFAGHMDLLFAADDGDDYDAGADDLGDLSTNPEAAVAYSKRVIAAQQLEEQQRAKPPPFEQRKNVQQKRSSPELGTKRPTVDRRVPTMPPADVLFDVDNVSDEEEDDGFGDFEGGATDAAAQPESAHNVVTSDVMAAMDLLALEEGSVEPQSGNGSSTRPPVKQSRPPERPLHSEQRDGRPSITAAEDDAWDDFEESAAPVERYPQAIPTTTEAGLRHSRYPASTQKPPSAIEQLAPTNIPPPSILLSIFPAFFASAQEALFSPLAKLDFKQRQVLLAHPATSMFLKGYLSLSVVLGHILAGRKLRWKRDQYLAQGMRIGPAAAGGGMKLAGIDKAEVAKEEREVLDVVRQWKAQVGKLKGAVTTASSTPGMAKLHAVPEIAEQMPVKSLKPAEGGITAMHACALCGLKREERVAKVDVEVDDSFGEWWVQGMNMHVVCRDFWEEYKGRLRSR